MKNRTYEPGSFEEMAFKLYNTCQSTNFRLTNYFKTVLPDVNLPWPQDTPDGIPWPKERFQWLVTLARMHRYGMNDVLLDLKIKVDREDHSEYMVVIKEPNSNNDYSFCYGDELFDKSHLVEKGFNTSQADSMSKDLGNLESAFYKVDRKKAESYKGKRLTLQQLERDYGISLGKYLETVFERQFAPSFQLQIDNLDYLVELYQLLSTYNQETVACYLMLRFDDYMNWALAYNNCDQLVRSKMLFGTDMLFEEHVLGEKKVQEYQAQVPQIFGAIIKSFKRRLKGNRLNLPLSQISYFLKFLDGISINVGSMPNDRDHRRFVTDYYADLDFDDDDDLDTMRLKLSMLRTRRMLEKLDHPVSSSSFNHVTPNDVDFNTINIPYTLLAEPFYMTRGHEVFKFGAIGTLITQRVLEAFHNMDEDFDCVDLINLVKSLDDRDFSTNKEFGCGDSFLKTSDWRIALEPILLSLVYDAYFSTESGFDHSQPVYTGVPLKQLFFLQIARKRLLKFTWISDFQFDKFFSTIPAFTEAFNCSNSSMIHQR
nr:uncharacterized protein LOC108067165 [Drosophila takahashii]